jgi:FkbH-like protein
MTHSSSAARLSLASKLSSRDPAFWTDMRLASEAAQTASEIVALAALCRQAIRHGLTRAAREPQHDCRVAVIGAYATYPLSELVLHFLMTSRPAVNAELFLGDFDNYVSEVMETDGALARFKPEVVVILPSVQRCRSTGLLTDPPEVHQARALATAREVLHLASAATKHTGARIVLGNFPLAPGSDPGPFRGRSLGTDWSFRKLVNLSIGAEAPGFVTICDLEYLSARRGVAQAADDGAWFDGKQLGSMEFIVDAAREIAHLVAAPFRTPAKVVVLDLDNTMWGGVIGDDGVDGIILGGTDPVGEAYRAFQQHVRSLKERGFLLAVASKNDHNQAVEPFKTHPEMVIRMDDIASFQANWGPKPDSLRAVAQELGLGLDSFVFIDDNPAEIEHVRQALPEVRCLLLDEDPARRRRQLEDSSFFEVQALTQEDRERSHLYRVATERQLLQSSAPSFEEYLRSLAMIGELSPFRSSDLVRIAQLISRSNQFNLTTVRRGESELAAIMADAAALPFTMRLKDRFGDYGLIAVVIARINGLELVIDTWLMSCRVLKRQVEEAVFNELVRLARERGLTQIRGQYLPTPKNGMVRDLYTQLGFRCVLDQPDRREFLLDVASAGPLTTHITILSGPAVPESERPLRGSHLVPAGPVSSNGRADSDGGGDHDGPAQPGVETEVASVWSDVLGVPPPRRNENFFELGGDSLRAMQAHLLLRDRFPDKPLAVADLFRFPTIAALGALLGAKANGSSPLVGEDRPELLYFGPTDRWLFGILHHSSGPAKGAVLCCYPLPPLYQLCYRAFRQLAVGLAERGYDVLRFDYSGVGDSAGEPTEASVDRWSAEVKTALAYLRSRTAARSVSVVAMRVGAALAAQALGQAGTADRLVLWEPVIAGNDFVADVGALSAGSQATAAASGDTLDFYGFPVTARFRRELAAVSLVETPPAASRTLLIESEERPASLALESRIRTMRRLTLPGLDWKSAIEADQVIVPAVHLKQIIHFLTEP